MVSNLSLYYLFLCFTMFSRRILLVQCKSVMEWVALSTLLLTWDCLVTFYGLLCKFQSLGGEIDQHGFKLIFVLSFLCFTMFSRRILLVQRKSVMEWVALSTLLLTWDCLVTDSFVGSKVLVANGPHEPMDLLCEVV